MNKGIRLIKRMVALFLVLLLSIESFAAVVSDNDGSAFITKAEFDSLKNNFQSQIDQYNTSIDSKIDGAIASYLAGVKIEIETYISMIDNIRHFTDINNVTTSNPRVAVTYCISSIDNQKNAESNWVMGYEGSAKINTMGTTGEGVIAECVNTTKKIYILGKRSSIDDIVTGTVLVNKADRGPVPGPSGRVGKWQLCWSINNSFKYDNGYFSTQQFDESNWIIWPATWGVDTTNTSWSSQGMFGVKPYFYSHVRTVKSLDDSLSFFTNDAIINTLYDSKYYNGVEIVEDASLSNSTIDGFFKIVNNGFKNISTANDNNNPFYREWNGHTDESWTLIGDETNNVYLGMWKEVTSWNDQQIGTSGMFEGKNKELYVSHINNPDRVFAGNYKSNTWNTWAQKIIDTDKVEYENNIYLWNIRYGNLLFAEDINSDAKFTVEIYNNSNSDCFIKFVTNPTSKKFSDVQGIDTDKSDSTNKNQIKIEGKTKKSVSFTRNNSDPVFFKLNDGADVTFGEYIIKREN